MMTDQQIQTLNEDVEEFIEKLKLQYPEPLAIAAALTQHGLRYYKHNTDANEFAHLLVYIVESHRLL